MVRTSNHLYPPADGSGHPSIYRWLRIHGLTQVRAAWAAWPRAAGPLCLLSPCGAAETLGPGWPEAVRAALTDGSDQAWAGAGEAPVILAMDCGAALGFALAALGRWASSAGDGAGDTVRLLLALDDSVPEAARAALEQRAAGVGALIRVPSPRPSLDIGPTMALDLVRDRVRALAGEVDGRRG